MDTPLNKLKEMAAWQTAPELAEEELESILANASIEDKNGHRPGHIEWTETYDLNMAAAAAWAIKAGRASNTTESGPEAAAVTSRIFDNCLRMAAIYRNKANLTISTARPSTES